jgi:hypothetical protein
MTYRLDFDNKDRMDEPLCLWHCEAEGMIKQVVFLTPSEMDIAFDAMDSNGREFFEQTNNLYWGIFLVNMFFAVHDAVDWNVDCVLVEHSGDDDYVSCSIEVYRDPDSFEIETVIEE